MPFRRTAAFIALHARRRPNHVAVIRDRAPISYAQLHRDLTALTHALAAFAPPAGATAAVGHGDPYIQLLLVFALDSLGVVTGSYQPAETTECQGLLNSAALILAQHPRATPAGARLFVVTEAWLSAVFTAPARSPRPPAPALPEEAAVIFRSSGTTGAPKRMVLTHRVFTTRLRAHHKAFGLHREARYLATMHLAVGSAFRSVTNCLRLGCTIICYTSGYAADLLAETRPTHMTMLPYHLRLLLSRLPPATTPGPLLPGLTMQTIGATLPADLRRLALQTLAGATRETYGTNESGSIGEVGADGLVTLAAGVEVEIVDARGVPLPAGETGSLRVRGPGVVAGYAGDAAATAEMFRNGWFHPGDIAGFVGPRRLRLAGRRGDVVNMGGMKRASALLESEILAAIPLADVAVCQHQDGTASPPIVVCAVSKAPPDRRHLTAAIERLINVPFTLRLVPEIPRTPEGKIKRAALLASLASPKQLAPA